MTSGKEAARDLRYGRRAGGWVAPAATPAKNPTPAGDEATCPQCGATYRYRTPDGTPPASCGRLLCRARADWTPADWQGQARMADARVAAAIPLTELDLDALDGGPRR